MRKGLVVGSLDELVQRGRDKLGLSLGEPVRLVLESDGTQVEDAEYFRTLPANTILLLLRPGERWLPAGVDVIRAGKYLYLYRHFRFYTLAYLVIIADEYIYTYILKV